MQKITPFLWFNGNAEEAVNFYAAVFEHAKVGKLSRYGDAGPFPKGTVMTAEVELFGQKFVALNGGPHFQFTPAVSFYVDCETQAEVDRYWSKLTEGGEEQPCGWLVDKFGVSWQIIPSMLVRLLTDPDPQKAGRVAQAMFKMTKIDIATIEKAAAAA